MPRRKWKLRKPEQQELNLEKCLWCEKPGTHLCDLVIGRDKDDLHDPGEPRPNEREVRRRKAWGKPDSEGRPPGTLMYLEDTFLTCDAPMCDDHRQVVGHICGRPHFHDTFDMCWYHWGWTGEDIKRTISLTEAEAYRRRLKMAVTNGMKSADHEDFYG